LRPKLLLATNNQAKVREYKSLLLDLPCELVTLAEQGINISVSEVGESLEENARLKATVLAAESQLIALADDSGLEVDAWAVSRVGCQPAMPVKALRIGTESTTC